MKKYIITLFVTVLIVPCYSNIPPKIESPFLKGRIVSNEVDKLPHFRVYYQGIQTKSDDDGFFSIPLENKEESYSILICKEFFPNFDSINTIKNLAITPKPYDKFYTFSPATIPLLQKKIDETQKKIQPISMRLRLIDKQIERQQAKNHNENVRSLRKRKLAIQDELDTMQREIATYKEKELAMRNATEKKPAGIFWLINEKKLTEKTFVIPDNCVVVCLNPKTVNRIKNWIFTLPSRFTSIPRIVLKKNLETKNVKRKQSITRSAIKSQLPCDPFHQEIKTQSKRFPNKPNVKVSLSTGGLNTPNHS
jgi:hypothetical protein